MLINSALPLYKFVYKNYSVINFEDWLYNNSELEDQIGSQAYLELISINFKSKHSRHELEKVIEENNLISKLHSTIILNTLESLKLKIVNPREGFFELDFWTDKGYTFLCNIEAMINFGEQGKSILYVFQEEDSISETWDKIMSHSPNTINDID